MLEKFLKEQFTFNKSFISVFLSGKFIECIYTFYKLTNSINFKIRISHINKTRKTQKVKVTEKEMQKTIFGLSQFSEKWLLIFIPLSSFKSKNIQTAIHPWVILHSLNFLR